MKRTAGQILMLLLVIAGSLLMSFQGVLPWNQQTIQWLFGVMGVLLLGFFIDGLIVFRDLLRQGMEHDRGEKALKERNR
mgnify:CR=1 FL=1